MKFHVLVTGRLSYLFPKKGFERHIYLDDAGDYYQIHPQELLTTGTDIDDN